MLSVELDEFIRAELHTRSLANQLGLIQVHGTCATPSEKTTHGQLAEMLERTSPLFSAWRQCHPPELWRHGIDIVQSVLAAPARTGTSSTIRSYRQAVLETFHPHGTHFDCFVLRLHASMDAPFNPVGQPSPSAFVRTAKHFILEPVLYDECAQKQIVKAILETYEQYFATIGRRFGESIADDVLHTCVDMFRRDVGDWLPRFRPRILQTDREWIATALNDDL